MKVRPSFTEKWRRTHLHRFSSKMFDAGRVGGRRGGVQESLSVSVRFGCPAGEDRIEWVLLTNKPSRTLAQAKERVREYAFRWRIDEFHRAWKSGGCNVEQSQLESESALRKRCTTICGRPGRRCASNCSRASTGPSR